MGTYVPDVLEVVDRSARGIVLALTMLMVTLQSGEFSGQVCAFRMYIPELTITPWGLTFAIAAFLSLVLLIRGEPGTRREYPDKHDPNRGIMPCCS